MVFEWVSVFSYFTECVIIFAFLSFVLPSRDRFERQKILKFLLFFLTFVGIVVINKCPQNPIPIFFIGIVLQTAVSLVVFEGPVFYKVLSVLTFYAALSASDLITFCIVDLLVKVSAEVLTSQLVPYITSFCISKVFLIFILSLICRFKTNRTDSIKLHNWLLMIVIPISSIVCLFSIMYFSLLLNPKGNSLVLAASASAGILIINASIFYIMEMVSESNRIQTQYLLMKQNTAAQYKRFREIEDIYEQTKIFKHDLDKHLSCISSLVEQNNYEEVHQYLNGLKSAAKLITIPILSGNPIIDTIINTKYNVAKQRGIQMQITACNVNDVPMEQIDLCAIVANLLDNAIESCEKITDEKIEKFVKINLMEKNEGILLSVSNSVEVKPDIRAGRFVSTKSDAEHHGIGLKSVRQSVEKYHGIFETGFDESRFSAVVFLKY